MRIRTILITVLCVSLVAAFAGRELLNEPPVAQAMTPVAVPVRVVSVEQRDVADYASGIGRVASLHSVVVRTQVDGMLTRLHVKEGQWVKAGELLATIDDRSIRASLAEARAQLGQSQA